MNTLRKQVGEQIFETICARRQQKSSLTLRPGWVVSAEFLCRFILPADAWAEDTNIIALVQNAIRDLQLGREAFLKDRIENRDDLHRLTPEENRWIEKLANMEADLRSFLQRNDLPIV